ncbi:MAG: 3-dehydroquinate synthase [Gemmatimonadetes bacterium]|nr:3-dehydroquinate synthase [Gemmatimonadota bacterium]MBI3567720.1 3-dehydroquinate synthase [Gemmatimonadota bacterium]
MSGPARFELHGSRIVAGTGQLDACGPLVRDALGARRLCIVSDDTVAPLWAARLATAIGDAAVPRFKIPAGEASKTRTQWSRLTDELLDAGFGRDSAILALGGGVVGDLAGFVAATYMRGIPFVQVPTTLLAMIDASIGGKTGVDTRAGKNLVGAFHHPALVVADPATLATLPREQLRNGLAEAVKHAVVSASDEFEWLERHLAVIASGEADPGTLDTLVQRHVAAKWRVVSNDERETGLRKVLNFGHTIGHAIEALSEYTLLHGECVAIGMVVEARAATLAGVTEPGVADAIATMCEAAGLPTRVPASLDARAVVAATRTDKKARGGHVEYAVPVRIGLMAAADLGYAVPLADAVIFDALSASR